MIWTTRQNAIWQRTSICHKSIPAMLKQLGITSVLSTAHHPQTDSATDCINQEIKAYLAIYCHSHLESWKKSILTLEFTHNNRIHANWPKTSFKLIMGESPKAIPKVFKNMKFPLINEKIKKKHWQHINWQGIEWQDKGKTHLFHLKKDKESG